MTQNNIESFDYEKSRKKTVDGFMKKIRFVDKYLNRPQASLVVKAVYKTRVTPNGLTYFSSLLGIVGAFFFSRGEYVYFILGGIFAQMSSVVDGADGMLARAKNMCSEYGAHLDLLLDRIVDFFVIVGMTLGASRYFQDYNLMILGFLTAGLYLLQIHLFYQTKSYRKVDDRGDNGEARAVLYWGFLICSIVNRLDIAIYLLLVETVIVNVVRLIYFISLGSKKA